MLSSSLFFIGICLEKIFAICCFCTTTHKNEKDTVRSHDFPIQKNILGVWQSRVSKILFFLRIFLIYKNFNNISILFLELQLHQLSIKNFQIVRCQNCLYGKKEKKPIDLSVKIMKKIN